MESLGRNDWSQLSERVWNYQKNKFKVPYRNTVKFIDWLEKMGLLKDEEQKILDAGCGCGANLYYIKKRFPKISATGIDINDELIRQGNLFLERKKINDCKLIKDDLLELKNTIIGEYTGVVSFETLPCLPDYRKALKEIIKLDPFWIALMSLFFEGPVNCKIEVEFVDEKLEDDEPKKSSYNIYSINEVKQLFEENGYKRFVYAPFEIDIDLKKPMKKGMGAYTETLKDGRRLQFSGPLLLPEYFLCAIKN